MNRGLGPCGHGPIEGPPTAVKIPRATITSLMKDAGFPLVEDNTTPLPYQYLLFFSAS